MKYLFLFLSIIWSLAVFGWDVNHDDDPFDLNIKCKINSQMCPVYQDPETYRLLLFYEGHYYDISDKIHFWECPCFSKPNIQKK